MENKTKLRLLYIYQYLLQMTDPEHPKSTAEITQMLQNKYGIKAARNTIGDDLSILRNSDLHISYIESTQNKYYYDGHPFEVSELKLLMDALCAAQFITDRTTEDLIKKLLTLTTEENAASMIRHISIRDHVKSDSRSGYYSVDSINTAIDREKKIRFYYVDYDMNKQRIRTNDGEPYTLSPYDLVWDGNFYYVRGFCDERQAMRTFRLDRIEEQPEILEEDAVPKPGNYCQEEYNRAVFRMFDTEQPIEVELQCHSSMMKYLIDNFGKEFDTEIIDENTFRAKIKVCTSSTFHRWVFGFGGQIRIVGPEMVVEEFRSLLREATALYEE